MRNFSFSFREFFFHDFFLVHEVSFFSSLIVSERDTGVRDRSRAGIFRQRPLEVIDALKNFNSSIRI